GGKVNPSSRSRSSTLLKDYSALTVLSVPSATWSAPDGQRRTWAATASGDAASGAIHRLREKSKTAGNPRTHTPVCWQLLGSNVTVMPGVSYTCNRFVMVPLHFFLLGGDAAGNGNSDAPTSYSTFHTPFRLIHVTT